MTEADRRLYDLLDDRDYVDLVYRMVLERPPDEGGLEFYLQSIRSGKQTRRGVLEQIYTSDEGTSRNFLKCRPERTLENYIEVFPAAPFAPWVVDSPLTEPRLNECVNPRKWLDQDWLGILRDLGLSPALEQMHRKPYEWVQTIHGLRHLDMLQPTARCLGVGSGHEAILYWLANQVAEVVATDLYEGEWTERGDREGDPVVLHDPDRYAPFPYRRECLRFLRMDGRQLQFDDHSFDFVFSLGSIEHFGGNEAAATAMREMARVCKPGGIVVLATELILNERDHEEFFTVEQLREYIVAASGMKLVQLPVFEVPVVALALPCVMPAESHQRPHLVLDFDGVLTTTVILFFRRS